MTLRDEKNQPVPDEDVSLLFSHVIDARSLERKGRTDIEGKFGAEEKIISSLMITVAKNGFHPIHWDRALIRTDVDNKKFKEKQGKWRGELILSLAGKEEGIATVDADYHPYSGLRMPHLAYESGYQATLTRKEETFTPGQSKPGIGYFLRSRVQLDEAGKIVSANYAKIIEDIVFDARGRVGFTYIFNPTPNDRNLEFDPARNLFGELPDDQQVRTP